MKNINNLVKGKEYYRVYDVFMGSGNILLNLDCFAEDFIGNDNIPLIPHLYKSISNVEDDFTLEELQFIIDYWNKFSDKKYYYCFRDYWNEKYLNFRYDRNFIYETIVLLKMCSNSMVRFNASKGYFNQGFRGLAKGKTEFFSENMKSSIIIQLNELKSNLQSKRFDFIVGDFKDALSKASGGDLVILDPPYILRTDMYDTNFSREDDIKLLEFLQTTGSDYIYFNYLESGDYINEDLIKFINTHNPYFVEELSNKTLAGQGRQGTKKVVEVMISNIRRE